MLGITFKENCPDIRNTKAIDVYNELLTYNIEVDVYDPWASKAEVKHEYGMDVFNELPTQQYDAIILTVAHKEFNNLDINVLSREHSVLYDVKGFFEKEQVDARL